LQQFSKTLTMYKNIEYCFHMYSVSDFSVTCKLLMHSQTVNKCSSTN